MKTVQEYVFTGKDNERFSITKPYNGAGHVFIVRAEGHAPYATKSISVPVDSIPDLIDALNAVKAY